MGLRDVSPRIFLEVKGECECEKVHPNQYLAPLKCLIKAKVFSLWLCVSLKVLVINPGWCIQGESSQTPLLCTISILAAKLQCCLSDGNRMALPYSGVCSCLRSLIPGTSLHRGLWIPAFVGFPSTLPDSFLSHLVTAPRPFGFFHLICSTS